MTHMRKIIKKCDEVGQKSDKSEYYRFGFSKFGCFLYGFTRWLVSEINERDIKKIFFLSRDGYMMEKAFDFMSKESPVSHKYTYFSRNSLRQALFWNCDGYKDSLKYMSSIRFITVRGILEYYGFSEKEINDVIKEYGINPDKSYISRTLSEEQEIAELYGWLEDKIKFKSRIQYELLMKYIIQLDMSGNCAIVDIGWNGSMQYYLESFIELSKLDISLSGFYVGIQSKYPIKGSVSGYLYNNDDTSWRRRTLCFLGGFEKLFQSCEGSCVGYIEEDGIIKPLNRTYEYENDEKCIDKIKQWQSGAMDFLDMIESGKVNVPDNTDNRQWAVPLIRFGQHPSNSGVRLFSFFYIEDGRKQYFTVQKKLKEYNIREFIRDLSDSPWKTGFMKSAFKLPLPYYLIYRIIKK